MEIRVQDPAVPGDLKAEGTAEGKMSEKAGQDLAAEALKENEKLISGEILLNEVIDQTESMKEEAETGESEKAEKSSPSRDTASVSYSPDVWDEEEWSEAFRKITDWRPSEIIPISEELSQLARIYQELLLVVLTHGAQEGGEAQMERLNKELPLLLQKLLMSRFGDLELLLKNYGSPVSITALRATVCRSVMGKNLTEAELNQIFGHGDLMEKSAGAVNESGIRTPISDKGNEKGMGIIYQPAGSGTIKNNPEYEEKLMKETSMIILEKGASLKGKARKTQGASLTISPLKTGRVYEIKDLETAQRYAAYMSGEGNLFKLAGLTGKSEELWGFLAALMSIKSQVFISYLGMEKGLAVDLREAGDRMTDELIKEMVSQSSLKYSGAAGRKPVFQAKDVYKIFYYIMNLYQTKADVNQAANKGIRYAFQQFLKKKEVSEKRREPESFFTKEKKEPAEDFKEGRKLIERDWKEFSELLNNGLSSELPQGVLVLSPWGMLVEPETAMERSGGNLSPVFLVGGGTALVILIIIFSFILF